MRAPSVLPVFLLGVGLGLGAFAVSSCGTITCTSKTCAGCCDAQNTCQLGTQTAACGARGSACVACADPRTCSAGACRSAGTGGGGGGGGTSAAGGGDGGGAGCRVIQSYPVDDPYGDYRAFQSSVGHYDLAYFGMDNAGLTDTLGIEVLWANEVGPTPPFTQSITTASYQNCSVCAVYKEGCDAVGNCKRAYLGRSGTVSISRADRAPAGWMTGSADSLQFSAWDLNTDQATGTACITVGQVPIFAVAWNHDGGLPPP
jgi:hypothetical protein